MQTWSNQWKIVLTIFQFFVAKSSFAADSGPISKKIDNAQVMERVQLVGVIAGSKPSTGIAVIKDALTGKTYAIKAGDNLPGVAHIKLQNVKRELAVFSAEGKEYHVRLVLGGGSEGAAEEVVKSGEANKSVGPGLFEKWYGAQLGEGVTLIDGALKQNEPEKKLPTRMVTESKAVETKTETSSESKINTEQEAERRNSVLSEYLRGMSLPRNKKGAEDRDQESYDERSSMLIDDLDDE